MDDLTGGHDRPAMAVTDGQAAALRAYLAPGPGPGEAERLYGQLAQAGGLDGYSEFALAAFVLAARRRFAPAWSRAEVIRFVAAVRGRLAGGTDIAPLAAEMIIRAALGDEVMPVGDEDTRGAAQIILLPELITAGELDDAGLDDFIAAARAQADLLLASRT
jgi:hypothetical protein